MTRAGIDIRGEYNSGFLHPARCWMDFAELVKAGPTAGVAFRLAFFLVGFLTFWRGGSAQLGGVAEVADLVYTER
jgi:hypothetical protein